MNEFANAFWREFQYRIINFMEKIATQYPVASWIILYVISMPTLFFCLKFLKYSFLMYKKSKNIKSLQIFFIFLLPLIIVSYFLIKFCIYKSDGYLIYPCIFTILSIIITIFLAIKSDNNVAKFEIQNKKSKKPKGEKVKFDKPKNKLNLKNVKFKSKNQGNIDETD